MRFKNGSNKVVIELWVMQFWSEIILVFSNRTRAYDFRPNYTPLSSITIIYKFVCFLYVKVNFKENCENKYVSLLFSENC